MTQEDIITALENSEFFKGLDRKDIERVAGLCRIQNFETAETVFQQGDFGEYIFIISEGHVYLERAIDLETRKGRVVIETLGRGRVMGCWSTLLGKPHIMMSTAVCRKPSRMILIKGQDLRNLMLENTSFGFNVMERFCSLMRDRVEAAYGAFERI